MHTVYISIGGNLNDTMSYFKTALVELKNKQIVPIQTASIYSTEAWGFESEHTFLNSVIEVKTDLDPFPLLEKLQEIEKELGRDKKNTINYTDRTIDLDILFYDNQVINTDKLIIPHKNLHLRNFVLYPLNEIIPDFYHPVLGLKIRELLLQSTDNQKPVKKIKPLIVNT